MSIPQTSQNNFHAEEALLGCLMIDNSSWDEISGTIHAVDFELLWHRDIFRAIEILLAAGKGADTISIERQLTSTAVISTSDEFVKLWEISRSPFSTKNIKLYADGVRQKSIDRQMISAAQQIISSVHEQKEDRLDYAQQYFSQIADTTTTGSILAADSLHAIVNALEERRNNQGVLRGISTGYNDLDKLTHGLHGGDLIILAGRPSMGKTLLAINIAEHVVMKKNEPVLIFSLEMSKEQLLERCLASLATVEMDYIRSGKLTDVEYQKILNVINDLTSAKLFIDDRSSISISDIRSQCRKIKREHGLSLVVVDYLTLIAGEGENETLKIGNISRGLKLLARDLNVPVIAISQLNRSLENRADKRPGMADLRQSGAIEQDADVILFIYRDEIYNRDTAHRGIAELSIAKHRHGSLGIIHLAFQGQYCRFNNFTGTLPEGNIVRPLHTKQFVY